MADERPIDIDYASNFLKAFKKLPEKIRDLARQKELLFRANPFHQSLKTHKLKGELNNYWSYSVNFQHRVLFRFIDDHSVLYYDIGTHDIYN